MYFSRKTESPCYRAFFSFFVPNVFDYLRDQHNTNNGYNKISKNQYQRASADKYNWDYNNSQQKYNANNER